MTAAVVVLLAVAVALLVATDLAHGRRDKATEAELDRLHADVERLQADLDQARRDAEAADAGHLDALGSLRSAKAAEQAAREQLARAIEHEAKAWRFAEDLTGLASP